MEHLTEEQVAGYAAGRLDGAGLAAIDAHLNTCTDCTALVSAMVDGNDEAPTQAVGARPIQSSTDTLELSRGTLLGRYMVLERIGSGGLGHVHAAYDPELDRKVAIKLLKPSAKSIEGSQMLQVRLLREAQAMAKLSHPNVVTVYDVGTLGDQVFIAMELIDGLTLRQWGKKQRRTWREVRDVMVKAGEGIIAAHDAGLIHRDFKPGNILISEDGRVRVLDFGIARGMGHARAASDDEYDDDPDIEFLDDTSSDATEPETRASLMAESLTRTGMFMGTPGYMPPEQYDPHAELDGRADQFAFCVTFHEALYRKRPFRGRDVKTLRFAARNKQVISEPKGANVPSWLRKVILQGLEPKPQDRFTSMRELLDLAEQDKRTRKKQWAAFAAVAAVSGLSVFGVMALQEPAPEETAIVEQLTNEARAAAALSHFVYPPSEDRSTPTALTKVEELEHVTGGAEKAADERAAELRDEFASTLVRLGDHYWDRPGGAAFAMDYYAEALVFREDARARERTSMTAGELALLRKKASSGEFSDAELAAADSLAALAETDEEKQVERLAAVYEKQKKAPSVSTTMRLERLLGEKRANQVVERASGANKKAEPEPVPLPEPEPEPVEVELDPELEELLALDEAPGEAEAAENGAKASPSGKRGGSSASTSAPTKADPKRAKAEAAKGRDAFKAGRLGEAESAYHRALAADRRNFDALSGLAELHFERGQYLKAATFGRRAISLSPKNGKLRILLGDAYFKLVRYDEAREQYERAQGLGNKSAAGRLKRLDAKLGK